LREPRMGPVVTDGATAVIAFSPYVGITRTGSAVGCTCPLSPLRSRAPA
jgi:hypothetical protein